MPDPNSGFQSRDAEMLAALLADLLPMLQSMRAESAPQRLAQPRLDQEAAVALVRDMTADSLRRLSRYLETHARQRPALESSVGAVTQAAQCYAACDYNNALAAIWQAYRAITAARAEDPAIPPLGEQESASDLARPEHVRH